MARLHYKEITTVHNRTVYQIGQAAPWVSLVSTIQSAWRLVEGGREGFGSFIQIVGVLFCYTCYQCKEWLFGGSVRQRWRSLWMVVFVNKTTIKESFRRKRRSVGATSSSWRQRDGGRRVEGVLLFSHVYIVSSFFFDFLGIL